MKKSVLIYFLDKYYKNDFQNKLKEFNQVRESYAHKETQTTTNVIKKSEPICFGYLSYIQSTQVAKREMK